MTTDVLVQTPDGGSSPAWSPYKLSTAQGPLLLPSPYRAGVAGAYAEFSAEAGKRADISFAPLAMRPAAGAEWRLLFKDGVAVRAIGKDGNVIGAHILTSVPAGTYEWWDISIDGRIERGAAEVIDSEAKRLAGLQATFMNLNIEIERQATAFDSNVRVQVCLTSAPMGQIGVIA